MKPLATLEMDDTDNDLPLLEDQAFTKSPEFDLALRRLNTRLSTLDEIGQDACDDGEGLHVGVVIVR